MCCVQVCYAKELKEGFVEYTEQVVKLMVPLLKFYFHDDILFVCFWKYQFGREETGKARNILIV